MKKIVSILLCVATLFVMVSCGTVKKESVISRDDEKAVEIWGGDSSSSSDTIITRKIQSALPFSDGVAFVSLVEYENDKLCRQYWVAIDTSGKILFELEEKGMETSWRTPYQNGVTVNYESYGDLDDIIYDKNGNAVASPEKNGYDEILAFQENLRYFIVGKTEESFSGDRYLIGVINNHGEFIRPLSDTHPIAQFMKENNLNFFIKK